LLRGDDGQPVTLRVIRADEPEPIDYRLVRAIIHVDSVLGDSRQRDNSWNFLLGRHPGIGYVRINSFGEQTVAEFAAAMQALSKQQQCRGLIIDMRNNPGGLLTSARDICDMFIQSGQVIVTTKDRDRRTREEYRGTGRGLYQKLPLVVLVNRGSASASEIVAACLQDQGRAKIVGQRTWGKGTVQHVIPVEGGQSVLRLTTASYWRPNGANIHRFRQSKDDDSWGVSPDEGCEVAMDDKQFTAWLEERRRRDVVYPRGKAPDERKIADAAEFDPYLKRALELLAVPASSKAAKSAGNGESDPTAAPPAGP